MWQMQEKNMGHICPIGRSRVNHVYHLKSIVIRNSIILLKYDLLDVIESSNDHKEYFNLGLAHYRKKINIPTDNSYW